MKGCFLIFSCLFAALIQPLRGDESILLYLDIANHAKEEERFEEALTAYTALSEAIGDEVLYPYILRADLYWDLGEAERALDDYSHVIHLVSRDADFPLVQKKILALWKRMFIYAITGEAERAEEDLATIKREDVHFPVIQSYLNRVQQGEDMEWILNDMGEVFIQYFGQFYIDIPCCKNCAIKNQRQEGIIPVSRQLEAVDADAVARCEGNCAYAAKLASDALAYIPAPISWIGYGVVWGMKRACIRCCQGGGITKTCILPFARILKTPVDKVVDLIKERFNRSEEN